MRIIMLLHWILYFCCHEA